jgi:hypothetical protein
MKLMILILLSDFMQVLHSIYKHPTKNEYFSKHIAFTMIYLFQEQKLNHRNYSEQEKIMRIFVRANYHDVHMHAKIQCMNMNRYLQRRTSSFDFL